MNDTERLNWLTNLAMWVEWEQRVKAALPNIGADRVYVDQFSPPASQFQDEVTRLGLRPAPDDQMRDAEFGARVVKTSIGYLTRMWLDSMVEMNFLLRHLPTSFADTRIIEVGPGYGRFAVEMAPCVLRYQTVDPVPVSREQFKLYTERFAPGANIGSWDVETFLATAKPGEFDLAINVHSWNECHLECIRAWLAELKRLRIPYLFHVSHGQNKDAPVVKQDSYYAWCDGNPSYRPLLEAQYELIAEENIGLDYHPHSLWKLKP